MRNEYPQLQSKATTSWLSSGNRCAEGEIILPYNVQHATQYIECMLRNWIDISRVTRSGSESALT